MNRGSLLRVQDEPANQRNTVIFLLWALGFAGFLVNADNRAIAPVLPAIANDLHIRESTAGLLISAYSIPYGIFQLVYGPIADRIGKVRTISTALILFCMGTIGCGLINSFSSLFTLRVITGIFAAGIVPISLAQIGDSFALGERPKAISLFMSFTTSGQALGIVFGAIVSQYYTWKWLFLLIGLGGVPAFILFLRQKSSQVKVQSSVSSSIPLKERYKRILRSPRALYIYLLIFLEGALFFGGFTFLSLYANTSLKLSYLIVGLLASLYSVSAFLGSRFITRAIAKAGQKNLPFLGSIIMTAAFVFIWLFPAAWSLALGFFLLGIGYSFCHSTLQTFGTELLPEARGTAMSLFAFFLFFGSGVGPAVLGYVYDWGGPKTMLAVTSVAFLIFSFSCKIVFQLPVFNQNGLKKP